ncbi:MAG: hypothetical protein ACREYB_04485 [Casimicrobiaceae bacterium]
MLRAAFGADETAVEAWRRWRDAIDWEAHLDHDAFRLLPRTYRNLRRHGRDDPLLPRLKGIMLQAWYANQRRARQFHPTVQALAAVGVELLIVPPTAVLLHDATAVLRRQVPLACAVRGSQAEAAIRCLWRLGWRAGVRLPRWSLAGYVLAADRLVWQDGDGQRLDLQWQCDPCDWRGRFPTEVWERAGRALMASEPVLILGAADTVHDLCRRPVVGNAFGRIADLLLSLDAMKAAPDWQRFFARARQAPVAREWQGILRDLRELVPKTLPASVITEWPPQGLPPLRAVPTGTMRERIAAHASRYREAWGEHYSFARASRQLPGYLLARWRLPSLGHLPLRLWRGLRCEWRDARNPQTRGPTAGTNRSAHRAGRQHPGRQGGGRP